MSTPEASQTTPKKKTVKKPRAPPAHPKYAEMIAAAIAALHNRNGSSRQGIIKYVGANYKVAEGYETQVKLALKRGVANGSLVQVKGTGASGSFKLAKTPAEPKKVQEKPAPKKVTPKKPAAKKVTKPAAKKATKPAAKKPTKPAAKKATKPAAKKTTKPAAKKATKPAAKKAGVPKAAPKKQTSKKPTKTTPKKKAAAKK